MIYGEFQQSSRHFLVRRKRNQHCSMLKYRLWGMAMGTDVKIRQLNCKELVRLNPTTLDQLWEELGQERADGVIGNAMDEMAQWLSRCSKICVERNFRELRELAALINEIAARIGMIQLAQASLAVAETCETQDWPAIAATTARMVRLGERSLLEGWNLQDLRL
jgi:hypothetical protein